MAFPAEGVEAAYRNNIDHVATLFNKYHSGHYRIYNLSKREYDRTKFEEGSVIEWCGFPDHHPPPLILLFKIVFSMQGWVGRNPGNVSVIPLLSNNFSFFKTSKKILIFKFFFV